MNKKEIKEYLESLSKDEFKNIVEECTPRVEDLSVDEFVYVAECFASWQTYYENPRHFGLFKETVVVSDAFVDRFRKLQGGECYDVVNDIMYDDVIQHFLPTRFKDLLYEDMIQCGDFEKKNVSQIIDSEQFEEWYGDKEYHPNDDLVGEIHFKCYYKNAEDLGTAYVSVYKIEKEKLEKHNNIDIGVRKWITDNIRR